MSDDLISKKIPTPNTPRKMRWFIFAGVALLIIVIFLFTCSLNNPSKNFPINRTVTIPQGTTVSATIDLLKGEKLIRSSLYAFIHLETAYEDPLVQAGSYTFDEPLTTKGVLEAVLVGSYVLPESKVTFPEGFRVADINTYLPSGLTSSDVTQYERLEGFLFPDTYFIDEDEELEDIISRMQETFHDKTVDLETAIEKSDFTLPEVIILASILEREANDEISMRTVSGILQNRLRIGMALQVDATFEYILDKTSAELTVDDLKIDSPFNTYTNRGLPPAPISNPGLTAINAVLNPIPSEYLYYLTGLDGNFYYAETFEEHKENKFTYLR